MTNTPLYDLPLLKIGDVAKRLETTTRTLRFYDQEGLIRPRRSDKGTRRYGEEEVERFRAILLLSRLGVPVLEIRRLATARSRSDDGNESSHKVATILEALRHDAEEKLTLYRRLLADIDQAETLVRRCFGCRKRPHRPTCDACPIGQNLPDSLLLKLVWDQPDASPG